MSSIRKANAEFSEVDGRFYITKEGDLELGVMIIKEGHWYPMVSVIDSQKVKSLERVQRICDVMDPFLEHVARSGIVLPQN